MWVVKHIAMYVSKGRLTYSVTVRILSQNNLVLLSKSFITKVLEYKAILNGITKFVSIAMCSLAMSLWSCDLHVMSLYSYY